MHIIVITKALTQKAARDSNPAQLIAEAGGYDQSPNWDSGFQRNWLKQNLKFKGWNSYVHREFPGRLELTNIV